MHFYKFSNVSSISQLFKLFRIVIFFLILNIHFHAQFYIPSFIYIYFGNEALKLNT